MPETTDRRYAAPRTGGGAEPYAGPGPEPYPDPYAGGCPEPYADPYAVDVPAVEPYAEGMLEGMSVLIVDDEPAVRDALRRSLSFEGYETLLAVDGLDALEQAAAHEPELIILDVLMPRMDGLTAARRLRAAGVRVPILMLTARDTVGDRVTGLDAGADDYLVKPFELDELLARIRALLRRSSYAEQAGGGATGTAAAPGAPVAAPGVLAFADLRMDLGSREVTRGGRSVELTRTEFMLLEMLLSHPRQVLTREQILKAVWGFDFEPTSNSLDVYVMYLRRKTEAAGEPRLVQTVRGVGFVLREADAGRGAPAGPGHGGAGQTGPGHGGPARPGGPRGRA